MNAEMYSRDLEIFRVQEYIDRRSGLPPRLYIVDLQNSVCERNLNVEQFIDEIYTLQCTLRIWGNEFPIMPDVSNWEVPLPTFEMVPDRSLRRHPKGWHRNGLALAGTRGKKKESEMTGLRNELALISELRANLISALVERWCPKTHTFHLLYGEVTITLQDVAVQLGLSINGEAVTRLGKVPDLWGICARLLGRVAPNNEEGRLT
ncbi:serine/threonine-protein phosphatase 7 long form-like protein [Gossypium australe]|uniref:Serine/threonine-protein phosphatase 7 long form-like protein n=1 Tax=Gossypium australe TaxID=47621 RepID=A0A5B6VYX9_9ROSI|nr:serine/threonine-protein phosphatase 7 long form-like protein [Gossypium australe]